MRSTFIASTLLAILAPRALATIYVSRGCSGRSLGLCVKIDLLLTTNQDH